MRQRCRTLMSPPGRFARPYSLLARTYDTGLGVSQFHRLRRTFETVAARYGLRFRSAADLGCGTGLFAAYLHHRWGVPVFALDRSPEMLAVARGRCPTAGVHFLRQDIRSLRLPAPVDLITANFDTLNHIIEPAALRAAFHRIYANLCPGGHFFFDLITHRQPLTPRLLYFRRLERRGRVWQSIRWDPRRRLFAIRIVFHSSTSPPVIERHLERAYSPQDIIGWLTQAGFTLRAVLDAFTLRLAHAASSRILVLAVRPR